MLILQNSENFQVLSDVNPQLPIFCIYTKLSIFTSSKSCVKFFPAGKQLCSLQKIVFRFFTQISSIFARLGAFFRKWTKISKDEQLFLNC